jgi:hypothetical protein
VQLSKLCYCCATKKAPGGEKFRGRGGAVVEAPAQTKAVWRAGAVGVIKMKIVYNTLSQLVDELE